MTVWPLIQVDQETAENLNITSDLFQSVAQGLSRFPHVRSGQGVTDRDSQIMSWGLPDGNAVKMYINPQNFTVRESKQITHTRTKGGFLVQYWGENLTEVTLQGTTGSSGIKGINILRDIYRSENRGFELLTAQLMNDTSIIQTNLSLDNDINSILSDFSKSIEQRKFLLRPSLASLATSVLLNYQGTQYKGFFTEFSVVEGVDKLGLFDYNMKFMVTETRGVRQNFMAWHREPAADDVAGQLINGIGNSIRGLFGLGSTNPDQFHPDSAPHTFSGSTLAASFGIVNSTTQESVPIII